MTLDDFKRIVDEASPTVFYIGLWNYGEPFINQSLCSMITYAKQQRMYVVTSTNGHFLDRGDTIKDLLESGLDRLIISLDGASPETYNLYRRGGDFERVLNGMRRLIQEKHKLGRAVPTVDLQFIVMRHNEHEIPLIRNVARSIGVDTLTIKTVGVSTVDQAEEYLPRVERSRYDRELFLATRRLTVKKRKRGCWTLWNQCVIGWDGVAYPCCYDNEILNPLNDLGNVLSAGLKAVWKGQRYNAFRGQVLRDKTQIPMCANCPEP
jgi:MoaA/NifB/PqqE/SkfB family radical SAM enzyme